MSHRQATTSVIFWDGNLHGELCVTPHGATKSNAEERSHISLGQIDQSFLGNQILPEEGCHHLSLAL